MDIYLGLGDGDVGGNWEICVGLAVERSCQVDEEHWVWTLRSTLTNLNA